MIRSRKMMWIKKAMMIKEKSRGTRLEAAKVRWHEDTEMREGRKERMKRKIRKEASTFGTFVLTTAVIWDSERLNLDCIVFCVKGLIHVHAHVVLPRSDWSHFKNSLHENSVYFLLLISATYIRPTVTSLNATTRKG